MIKEKTFPLKLAGFAIFCSLVWTVFAAVLTAQTIAFTNATIETMGKDGRIEDATLLVVDGKIADVGTDVEIPGKAKIVSLAGSTVMPGVVDPYYVFLNSRSAAAFRTVTFGGRTFRIPTQRRFSVGAFNKISEHFYPYNLNLMSTIRSGITTAHFVSDGRGLSAFCDVVTDPTPEMLIQDAKGFLFTKVTNQTTALDTLRGNLKSEDDKKKTTRASSSRAARIAAIRARIMKQRGIKVPTSTPKKESSDKTKKDEKKETDPIKIQWNEVRDGKQAVVVNVNNAATVAHVLKILEKHKKVKLYLVATGPNVFQSLEQIKKHKNVTVILPPAIDRVPFSSNFMSVPKMLHEMEIPFALSLSLSRGQMNSNQDDPMFPVSILVKSGLPRKTALEALTIKPAKMLGIDKRVGSLEKDKVANFLVFDGDPLATGNLLKQVYLKGESIYEN